MEEHDIDCTGTEDEVIAREADKAASRFWPDSSFKWDHVVGPLVRIILAFVAALGAKTLREALARAKGLLAPVDVEKEVEKLNGQIVHCDSTFEVLSVVRPLVTDRARLAREVDGLRVSLDTSERDRANAAHELNEASAEIARLTARADEVRWAADQLRPFGAPGRIDFGGAEQAIRTLLTAADEPGRSKARTAAPGEAWERLRDAIVVMTLEEGTDPAEALYDDVRGFTNGGQLEEDHEGLIDAHRDRVNALRLAFDEYRAAVEPRGRRGIYIASKAKHGPRWIALRAAGVPIVSTWIDESGEGQTSDWPGLWDRCIAEASGARALVMHVEPGEVHKGSLVEVGAALHAGVPVFWVGPEVGTVRRHRLVTVCETLDDAIRAALAAFEPVVGVDAITHDFRPGSQDGMPRLADVEAREIGPRDEVTDAELAEVVRTGLCFADVVTAPAWRTKPEVIAYRLARAEQARRAARAKKAADDAAYQEHVRRELAARAEQGPACCAALLSNMRDVRKSAVLGWCIDDLVCKFCPFCGAPMPGTEARRAAPAMTVEQGFRAVNQRRLDLVERELAGTITGDERAELKCTEYMVDGYHRPGHEAMMARLPTLHAMTAERAREDLAQKIRGLSDKQKAELAPVFAEALTRRDATPPRALTEAETASLTTHTEILGGDSRPTIATHEIRREGDSAIVAEQWTDGDKVVKRYEVRLDFSGLVHMALNTTAEERAAIDERADWRGVDDANTHAPPRALTEAEARAALEAWERINNMMMFDAEAEDGDMDKIRNAILAVSRDSDPPDAEDGEDWLTVAGRRAEKEMAAWPQWKRDVAARVCGSRGDVPPEVRRYDHGVDCPCPACSVQTAAMREMAVTTGDVGRAPDACGHGTLSSFPCADCEREMGAHTGVPSIAGPAGLDLASGPADGYWETGVAVEREVVFVDRREGIVITAPKSPRGAQ